jgi:hypothetical protein
MDKRVEKVTYKIEHIVGCVNDSPKESFVEMTALPVFRAGFFTTYHVEAIKKNILESQSIREVV